MAAILNMASVLIALQLAVPPVAQAQCSFNAPRKAAQVRSDMIRSYAACPGITFAAPNTATGSGVPACTSPVPLSSFQFGSKGACKLQLRAKREEPCSNPFFTNCQVSSVKLSCKDIRDSNGDLIQADFAGLGWTLRFALRVTSEDHTSGDLTVVDFPAFVVLPAGSKGKLKFSGSIGNDFYICNPPFCPFPLSGCTSFQILSASLVDPSDDIFATLGSSSH